MSNSASHTGPKKWLVPRLRSRLLCVGALRGKPALECIIGNPFARATRAPLFWRRRKALRFSSQGRAPRTLSVASHQHFAFNIQLSVNLIGPRAQTLRGTGEPKMHKATQLHWHLASREKLLQAIGLVPHVDSRAIAQLAAERLRQPQESGREARVVASRLPALWDRRSILRFHSVREQTRLVRTTVQAAPLSERLSAVGHARRSADTHVSAVPRVRLAWRSAVTPAEHSSASIVQQRQRGAAAEERDDASHYAFHRRAEIVWRKPSDGGSSDPSHVVRPTSRSDTNVFGSRTRESSNRAIDLSNSSPPRATAPLRLDPATADRLAEDVIQRVERRVRIERERRGL